jgi:hypothetical protein
MLLCDLHDGRCISPMPAMRLGHHPADASHRKLFIPNKYNTFNNFDMAYQFLAHPSKDVPIYICPNGIIMFIKKGLYKPATNIGSQFLR